MTQPPEPPPSIQSSQPSLTPQFCFNTTALRDFLRLSRSTVDDSISPHLNSLITPSRLGFSPSSTSTRQPTAPGARRRVPASACTSFKRDILFPSWQARAHVMSYCESVASNPDPSSIAAPTHVVVPSSADASPSPRQQQHHYQVGPSDLWAEPPKPATASPVSKNYWGKEQVVDERTDPYSARDYSYTREDRQQVLASLLQNERGVERIVRARTWSVLVERCESEEAAVGVGRLMEEGWEAEMERWRSQSGR